MKIELESPDSRPLTLGGAAGETGIPNIEFGFSNRFGLGKVRGHYFLGGDSLKIVMTVLNDCVNDARVLNEARALWLMEVMTL